MTDPKSEPSEQDAFEAWYGFEEANHVAAWERDAAGGYHSYYVQVAWESWQARAALTPAPAQPEPPTAAGVEPVAIVKKLFGGKIITTISDTFDLDEGTLLYATAPTLTDAQCDAIHFGLSEWAKDIDARMGLPRPDSKSRALIRAAVAQPPKA